MGWTRPLLRIDSASSDSEVVSKRRRGCQGPELIHSIGSSVRPDCAGAAAGVAAPPVVAAIPASPSSDDRPRPRPRGLPAAAAAGFLPLAWVLPFFAAGLAVDAAPLRGSDVYAISRCLHCQFLADESASGRLGLLAQKLCRQRGIGLRPRAFQIIDQNRLTKGRRL